MLIAMLRVCLVGSAFSPGNTRMTFQTFAGTGGDVAVDGKVSEIPLDLAGAHGAGMAPAVGAFVEAEEQFDPTEVAVFGAQGVVAQAEELADLFEEFHGTSRLRLPRAARKPGRHNPFSDREFRAKPAEGCCVLFDRELGEARNRTPCWKRPLPFF
jgi:hypothetical protein